MKEPSGGKNLKCKRGDLDTVLRLGAQLEGPRWREERGAQRKGTGKKNGAVPGINLPRIPVCSHTCSTDIRTD